MRTKLILLAGMTIGLVVGLTAANAAHATVMGIGTGDLIKLADDHNPATHEDEAVYYLDRDWHRRPFLNQQVFASWYRDFAGVKELSPNDMSEFRIGKPIVYRPGTRLVKIPSVPKVYAVEPGGVLRWIQDEDVAKTLYGPNWAQRVDDVSESFYSSYSEGAPIIAAVWPAGTFVRRTSDAQLFYLNGPIKRPVLPEAEANLRLAAADIILTDNDLSDYADGGSLIEADWAFLDSAQDSTVEPLSAPQLALTETASSVERGSEQTICTVRVSANQAVLVRNLRVALEGALSANGTPSLSDLHWVDDGGNDLFGINQLSSSNASTDSLNWNGAYLVPEGTMAELALKAKIATAATRNSSFSVELVRDAITLADGSNGKKLDSFFTRQPFSLSSLKFD